MKESLAQLKTDIETQDDKTANVSAFVEKVRRYTEIKELTPAIVNEFIDYITVSKKQVIDGKTIYPIDISMVLALSTLRLLKNTKKCSKNV